MSLKEIAQMTGTSVSTVSKVLNDSYSTCASKELKEKIWKAANETGYTPNINARNLKKGVAEVKKTRKIFVLMARIDNLEKDAFFKDLYYDLEIAVFKKGFLLDKTLGAADIAQTDFSGCDGIIVLGRCSEKILKSLKAHTGNIVGIWRNPMDFAVDEIVCDGRKAAETAVLYLRKLGHKNIGYIGDCSYETRYVGYSETMIRERLSIDYNYIVQTDQTKEEGALAMEKLLKEEGLTAVLCANDMTALGALETLKKYRKKDRKKISVISIDDIEEAQTTDPLLTTVHIPRMDMAHMAVEVLEDRLDHGHSEHIRVEFPCRITERESCFECPRQ